MTFDGHGFQLDWGRPLERARVPGPGAELLFASGGNMLTWRDAFLELGGFDEDYFAYLEDVDLGWRTWAAGRRVLHAPGGLVHHRGSATSDLLGQGHRGFLFERNAFLTAYKNYESGLWERLMPAVMLTLLSRLATLDVESNPGGWLLAVDPYAGLIANTAGNGSDPAAGGATGVAAKRAARWSRAIDGLRRALRGGAPEAMNAPVLADERTLAHHRAVWNLLGNLDRAAAKRARVQSMRRRADAEIFARFPLYVVPTYPGDVTLFASDAWSAWLSPDLPVERSTLDEVMAWGR
jgi:hypothetical protein